MIRVTENRETLREETFIPPRFSTSTSRMRHSVAVPRLKPFSNAKYQSSPSTEYRFCQKRSTVGGPYVTCEPCATDLMTPVESRYVPFTMGYPSGVHSWTRLQAGAGGGLASARSWGGLGSRPGTVGLGLGAGTMSSCWVGDSDIT